MLANDVNKNVAWLVSQPIRYTIYDKVREFVQWVANRLNINYLWLQIKKNDIKMEEFSEETPVFSQHSWHAHS